MVRSVFLLLILLPAAVRAHTTDFIGGSLSMRPDGIVELRMEILARRLPVYAGELEGAIATVGGLRSIERELTLCFRESLVVFSGGREVRPFDVEFPLLEQPGDVEPLPEFVPIRVLWRDLPSEPSTVIPRFDLPETFVMLVLDEGLGGDVPPHRIEVTAEGAEPAVAGNAPPVDATPTPAPAAGAFGWRTLGVALVVGYEHIVPYGLDHILFVLGLFFAVRRVRDLVWQVTMFTIAHSITLGLAMGGVVVLSGVWATAVEIGIAVSIVAVAVENCLVEHSPGWRRLAIVGAFGLVHGLGFAGALSEINWPADQFVPALLAANVGIELGQLTVVGVAALFTAWIWHRGWYRGRIAIPASVAIGLCGLFWAIERTAGAVG